VRTVGKGRVRQGGGCERLTGRRAQLWRGVRTGAKGAHMAGKGCAWVGKEMHMAGKGGTHRLWEGCLRVGMGVHTTVPFTNFRG
jgi:hypothetical protein